MESNYTPCLKKTAQLFCFAKLFLSELRQISTNFDNFVGRMVANRLLLRKVHSFSTSPNVSHPITMLSSKHRCSKLLRNDESC